MVLLTLLQRLPVAHRPKLIVAHVDHQLRQQSQVERQFITTYCQQHRLPLEVAVWPLAAHPATGIEAAAREFRYAFFERVMKQTHATTLVTAHHANDQAETVLMKLIRGGDLTQLVGIRTEQPFGSGRLVRPLLRIDKATLLAYAQTNHLTGMRMRPIKRMTCYVIESAIRSYQTYNAKIQPCSRTCNHMPINCSSY